MSANPGNRPECLEDNHWRQRPQHRFQIGVSTRAAIGGAVSHSASASIEPRRTAKKRRYRSRSVRRTPTEPAAFPVRAGSRQSGSRSLSLTGRSGQSAGAIMRARTMKTPNERPWIQRHWWPSRGVPLVAERPLVTVFPGSARPRGNAIPACQNRYISLRFACTWL